LIPLADNATKVQVVADVDIVGRASQFGRGMIESVNRQLFKQFAECLRGTLEAPVANVADMRDEAPPPAWIPPATSPRVRSAIPTVPSRPSEPVHLVPLVMHTFADWLRRVGTALVGRPRHP